MATITAVGPALDVDGPLPEPPPYRLLDIPGVLKEGAGRWQNGIVVDGYPPEVPALWEPCSSGTFRTKEEGGETATPRFDSFGTYIPISCSALGLGGDAWRSLAGRAETVLDATISFAAEEALSQGISMSSNKFLGDSAVTVLGGGAVSALVGLSWLEEAIGATARGGIIHATPAIAAAWSQYVRDAGGYLVTIGNGTPVAVGGGYIGATANGASPASGQGYAFASGPVEVFLSETLLVGDDINGTLDTSQNDVTFRAERFGISEWDTELQSAVLIDWTP